MKEENLHFHCLECQQEMGFCLLQKKPIDLHCSSCGTLYELRDETLLHQLQLFDALCQQIHASQEILSLTEVGVRVGAQEVQIPYRLLLSRLNPCLTLQLNGTSIRISFRVEPGK